jgi:hypothetical protein
VHMVARDGRLSALKYPERGEATVQVPRPTHKKFIHT